MSKPVSTEAGRHVQRLWDLGEIAFVAVMVPMAVQRQMDGLHGFLDAVQEDGLPDFVTRSVKAHRVSFDRQLENALGELANFSSKPEQPDLLATSAMEAFALALCHPDGRDILAPQREVHRLDDACRALLTRSLEVLRRADTAAGKTTTQTPFTTFCATVFARCRDPWAVNEVVRAHGSLHEPLVARLTGLRYGVIAPTLLARLAAVRLNPVAMHAVLDHPALSQPWTPAPSWGAKASRLPGGTIFDEMCGAFFEQGSRLGATTEADLLRLAKILGREMSLGTAHEPLSMTAAVSGVLQRMQPQEAAVFHGRLLTEVLGLAAREGSMADVEAHLVALAPQPLLSWYEHAALRQGAFTHDKMEKQSGLLIESAVHAAACSGRAQVLREFDPWLRRQVRMMAGDADVLQFPQRIRTLVYDACMKMCKTHCTAVSGTAFRSTLEVLVDAGFDLQRVQADEVFQAQDHRGQSLLHVLAGMKGPLVLSAMLHLVEMGCDPRAVDRQGKTPADVLQRQGSDMKLAWETALRSHQALQLAQAAVAHTWPEQQP